VYGVPSGHDGHRRGFVSHTSTTSTRTPTSADLAVDIPSRRPRDDLADEVVRDDRLAGGTRRAEDGLDVLARLRVAPAGIDQVLEEPRAPVVVAERRRVVLEGSAGHDRRRIGRRAGSRVRLAGVVLQLGRDGLEGLDFPEFAHEKAPCRSCR
jgi:hypothetical protein